jgi:hypothetical protein
MREYAGVRILRLACIWSVALVCAPVAPAAAQSSGYASVAEQLVARLDPLWLAREQRYDPGHGGTASDVNANLLVVYAVAAQRGLQGPTRDDARARSIVRFLTRPPIWRESPPADQPRVQGPGWMDGTGRGHRHLIHDSEVAEALAHAHAARVALGLDAQSVSRIRQQIARVARGPDYAWPALRLNQFNWYVDLFAADAQVNARADALASGMGRHLRRFLDSEHNLGPGLSFRYLPADGPRARMNLDSPEYANIVLGFSRHYSAARAAGMAPPRRMTLLHDWIGRALAGYWTHAGYLNWDTGLGFGRWHHRIKVPLAQRALIGIAATPDLQPSPAHGAWAKWLLDRGLNNYLSLLNRHRRIPAGVAYGVHEVPQGRSKAYVAAARYAANAMRALAAGLEDAPFAEPPALYSYDPDTGKLAVSTPAYNTAIVPVNQRAFPYGGLDLARLFDADQEVAGSLGGTGRAAFGLSVHAGGRTLLRTQYGSRSYGTNPLRLDGLAAARVHAGAFTDLRVHGAVRAHGVTATSGYRFTPASIAARWSARGHNGTASVTFPSWGQDANVSARLCDGHIVALGRTALENICELRVRSSRSGYLVALATPVIARLVPVPRQPSNPNPGPSVEVLLGPLPARLGARLTVAA